MERKRTRIFRIPFLAAPALLLATSAGAQTANPLSEPVENRAAHAVEQGSREVADVPMVSDTRSGVNRLERAAGEAERESPRSAVTEQVKSPSAQEPVKPVPGVSGAE